MIDSAIILAGGLGIRLRPLTENLPKPLLLVKDKPIVQHVIENLIKYGVKNIIISIGYKAELVKEYFKNGSQLGVNISYSVESEPLGTGGAIKKAAKNLNKPFYLAWGDNLADFDYHAMYKEYLREAPQVTMALTPREDVENFGTAKLDGNKLVAFVEKPKRSEAPSNLINAGAFIVDPHCLEVLPEGKSSMEKDCFEKLAPLGEISAHIHKGQWFPTDTLEKYHYANENFRPLLQNSIKKDRSIDFSQKRVIIADVDETICESCQVISEAMANEISRLVSKGYTFAFISGTGSDSLQRMVSSRLNFEHYLLATTGTNCTYCQSNGEKERVYNYSLPKKDKRRILTALEKLITHYHIETMTTKEDQIQDRDSQITLSAIGRHAPTEMKARYDPDSSKRREWVEFLKKELGNQDYDLKIGGTTSIDITKKSMDKEWGIRKFAEVFNLSLSSIVFIGDKLFPGGNDFPATKAVDYIAVENPQDTLIKLRQFFP